MSNAETRIQNIYMTNSKEVKMKIDREIAKQIGR